MMIARGMALDVSGKTEVSMSVGTWWNETDVLAYLETEPVYCADDYSYEYEVEQEALVLRLVIAPYDAFVHFHICERGVKTPLLEFAVPYCAGVRVINDQRGEYLEFQPSRPHTPDGFPLGVLLMVRPHIALRFVGQANAP